MHNKTFVSNSNAVVIELDSSTLERSLYYRDEGNMNVVVSLFAQDHDEKRVIRFKKISADDKTKFNHNDHKNELVAFVNFEELLQQYLENADQFTVVPKIVFLDVDVHALNDFLMRDRPVGRRDKIIGNNYGLLYRDVAFLPKETFPGKVLSDEPRDSSTICIEIKAKQGYMMNDENGDSGDKKCRFCFFQYLKLKNSRIKRVSRYCPLDLFSGHAERMNAAIKSLIVNPQNNLKMFQDGKMIFNERSSDPTTSFNRVLENLFPDVSSFEKQETSFVNLIRKILLKDFKGCDNLIDICPVLEGVENIHERNCINVSNVQLPPNSILKSILTAQLLVKDNFSMMEVLERLETHLSARDNLILQNYKIGSTALDCSIMITFRRINGNFEAREKGLDKNSYVTIRRPSTGSQLFAVNATIVDLDLKKDSLAHYRKYRKQCHESKQAYADFIANRTLQ